MTGKESVMGMKITIAEKMAARSEDATRIVTLGKYIECTNSIKPPMRQKVKWYSRSKQVCPDCGGPIINKILDFTRLPIGFVVRHWRYVTCTLCPYEWAKKHTCDGGVGSAE